jgi:hypothetical protein
MFAIIVSITVFINNIVGLIVQGVSVAKQWGKKKDHIVIIVGWNVSMEHL